VNLAQTEGRYVSNQGLQKSPSVGRQSINEACSYPPGCRLKGRGDDKPPNGKDPAGREAPTGPKASSKSRPDIHKERQVKFQVEKSANWYCGVLFLWYNRFCHVSSPVLSVAACQRGLVAGGHLGPALVGPFLLVNVSHGDRIPEVPILRQDQFEKDP